MGNFPSNIRHGGHRPAPRPDHAAPSPASHPIDLNDLDEADQEQPGQHPDPAPPQQVPGPPIQNAALQFLIAGMAPVGGGVAEGVDAGQADGAADQTLHRLIYRGQLQAVQARLDALPDDDGNELMEMLTERNPDNKSPLHLALIPGPADPQGSMLGRLLEIIPDEHVVQLLSLRDGLGSNVLQSAIQQNRPGALAACLNRIPAAELPNFLAQPVFPPPGADHLMTSNTLLHYGVKHDVGANAVDALMAKVNDLPADLAREILETRDDEGRTALHLAAQRGQLPTLQAMLRGHENRAGMTDHRQRTPMHHAAEAGQTHVVRSLLAGDQARGDARDQRGHTPLFLAAAEGHARTIAVLMEGEPDRADVQENGLLDMADVFQAVQEGLQILAGVADTPLHRAAANGHLDAVNLLVLDDVRRTTATNVDGQIPLHSALNSGQERTALALLDANPYTARISSDGRPETPLHQAAQHGYVKIVVSILNTHPDIAVLPNATGDNALHVAAAAGQGNIVDVFLQAVADGSLEPGFPKTPGNNRCTPLHYAARDGHAEVVEKLVAGHPERSMFLDYIDNRPSDLAAENGHNDIADFLNQLYLR